MSAEAPGTVSCVVDRHPRFHREALRWYACLTEAAGVDPTDLVVHTVGGSSSEALDRLVSAGVTVRAVEPFDGRSPHCNKISGALALADKGWTAWRCCATPTSRCSRIPAGSRSPTMPWPRRRWMPRYPLGGPAVRVRRCRHRRTTAGSVALGAG